MKNFFNKKSFKTHLMIYPFFSAITLCQNIVAQADSSPVTNGSQLVKPNESGVADGNPSNKTRATFYKNRHTSIPHDREVGVYYASWGVHGGRDYAPHQLPVERISHVYIGFGGICGENPAAYNNGEGLRNSCNNLLGGAENGSYYLSSIKNLKKGEVSFIDDNWAYFDKNFDSPNGKYSGQLAGMIDWKNRNPKLKVIWSLGGWSYSRPFYDMANSASGRKLFIDSISHWLSEPVMGFVDGIDLDWEFPGGEGADSGIGNPSTDGRSYIILLKELRAELTRLGKKQGKVYELSTAIGVGPSKLRNFKASGSLIRDMLPHIDRLGLMTYDFHGAWDNKVGFNAALDRSDSDSTTLTIKEVIRLLEEEHRITDFSKISLGLAFYGRSHGNVSADSASSLIGASSSGAGQGGSIESGVYSYFDLYPNFIGPDGKGTNGWQTVYFPEYAGALLWNKSRQQVISYTPPKGIEAMTSYAKSKNMKGVFAWTVDDDNGMLLQAIHSAYGHNEKKFSPRRPKHVYAPRCSTFKGTIKSGMLFSEKGRIYKAGGWLSNCPGQGAAWENRQWQDMSSQYNNIVKTNTAVTTPVSTTNPVTTPHNSPQNPAATTPTPSYTPPTQQVSPVQGSTATSSGNQWSRNTVYNTGGSIVTHNGKQYKNKWWTQGEEPGQSNVWELIESLAPGEISNWTPSKAYPNADTIIRHNGVTYRNKWYANTGEEPGVSAVWERTDSASDAGGTKQWSPSATYSSPGTEVIHNGTKYRNKWWTKGDEPGQSMVWEEQ
ncbi:Chitinase A [invertebrate metagenome]|uniref:Chitinase A n=1 Tax=invertebrate metagenome TaxID=1711999 RepID=A0A2H9T8C1_9ZZZZ